MAAAKDKGGGKGRRLPPNMYWRGDVIWARFKVRGVPYRESLRTGVVGVAEKRLRRLREETEDIAIYGGAARITWKTAVVDWRADGVAGIRTSTLKRYTVSLRMLRPWLDELDVQQVTATKVREIVAARRKVASNATVRRDLSALSSVLSFAVAQQWVPSNAAREFDRNTIKERRDPFELPERRSIDLVIAASARRFGDMIEFAEETGMRQEEIVGLSHRAIDANRMAITLVRTKARRRTRTVPITPLALAIIKRQPEYIGSDFVFWHGKGLRFANVSSRFGRYRKGVAQKEAQAKRGFKLFAFHDLRHLFAVTKLRERVHSLYDLQKIMGHASVKTTEQYLDFLTPEERRWAEQGGDTQGGTGATVSGDGKAASN